MGVAAAPLTLLAASERKICNLCHRVAVPLASSGRQPPPESQWGDKLGTVPGSSTMSRAQSRRLLRTWRSANRSELHAAPLRNPPREHFAHWVAEAPPEGRMTPAHPMISFRWKLPARHNSFFMASPQQSRIQSYLEKNKIGPLFEVSAPNATLKFLTANLKDHCFAPERVNQLLCVFRTGETGEAGFYYLKLSVRTLKTI